MAEFDFEELDKAVTSLMQKQTGSEVASEPTPVAPSVTASVPADDTATTEIAAAAVEPTTLSATDVSGDTAETKQPAHDADQQPATAADRSAASQRPATAVVPPSRASQPLTAAPRRNDVRMRRRGKFMDVVQSPAVTASAVKPPSRQASTVQPVNNIDTSATAPITEVPPRAVDGISQPPSTNQSVASSASTAMPDPIDVANKAEVDRSSVTPTEADTASVMSSPFLPDAKVEKRPLGVSNDESSSQSARPDTEEVPTDTSPELQAAQPADEAANSEQPTGLPAELGKDVLSLEQDSTSQAAAAQPVVTESPSSIDSPEAPSTTRPVASPNSTDSGDRPLSGALPPRLGSSASEEPEDVPPAKSIFDTDDPQPMKHKINLKSGWFVMVAIASILLVGIIGGVIVFMLSNG